jgi:hypothetical protein
MPRPTSSRASHTPTTTTMTTFSAARITRRALALQTSASSLHRSSRKQLSSSSSSLLDHSASTSARRTMSTLGNSGNASLCPTSRCTGIHSRAWMSTTPPGGDTKSAGTAKKEEADEKTTPSAASSSRPNNPRRIVVRSQKNSNNNNGNNDGSSNSNDKKNSNSNNRVNTGNKKDDIQVQVDNHAKSVGYIYRRRRNQHPSAATTTTSTSGGTSGGTQKTHRRRRPPLQQQQNQNARSTETTYDCHRVPVLIPGRERRPDGQQSAVMHHHHHYRHTLSTINASALLNTKEYCLKSAAAATSSSGTEAARRLLRGKKDVVNILRRHVVYTRQQDANQQRQQNVHPYQPHQREPPIPHALQGHGVPVQLLQNHLDLAGELLDLTPGNAAEVSFQNWSGELSLDWMRVRSQDGHSSVRPWPVVVPQTQDNDGGDNGNETTINHNDTMATWDQDMALYLSVMNRLATQLSLVLQTQSPPTATPTTTSTRKMTDASTTTMTDEYSNVFSSFKSSSTEQQIPMHPPPPRYWNVKVWRGMAFAADSLPAEPCPVVEWTPVQGLEAPGHVCVRLQGFPTRRSNGTATSTRRQPQAVTLSFTACFRNNTAPPSSSNGDNKRS